MSTKRAVAIAVIGVIVIGTLLFLLAGCSAGGGSAGGGSGDIFTNVIDVTVDGRTVTCITYASKGISCDW